MRACSGDRGSRICGMSSTVDPDEPEMMGDLRASTGACAMIFAPALLPCAAAAGEAVAELCVEASEGSEYATTFAVSRQYQLATASIESTVSKR